MRTLAAVLILAASSFGQVVHVFPATDTDNTFTGSNRFNKSVLLGEATCTAGGTGFAVLCSDATHQLLKNLNGAGFLNVVGIASAGVAGHCPVLAANGIDIVDSGATCSAAFILPTQYTKLRCETGLGDGLNAITAGTYLQSFCYNDSGVTWTITGIRCFTNNSGTSTLNAANGAGTALLTGAITCTSAFAAGTQSGTATIASGDFVKFTFVSDGASLQSTWVVGFTQ